MQVEVDTETVLASPFDRLEEVLPCNTLEEWFAGVDLDGPVGERDTNEVEPCSSDLCEVLLSLSLTVSEVIRHEYKSKTDNEGLVVILKIANRAVRIHVGGEGPLVHRR